MMQPEDNSDREGESLVAAAEMREDVAEVQPEDDSDREGESLVAEAEMREDGAETPLPWGKVALVGSILFGNMCSSVMLTPMVSIRICATALSLLPVFRRRL